MVCTEMVGASAAITLGTEVVVMLMTVDGTGIVHGAAILGTSFYDN